jgi:hypothetical protein
LLVVWDFELGSVITKPEATLSWIMQLQVLNGWMSCAQSFVWGIASLQQAHGLGWQELAPGIAVGAKIKAVKRTRNSTCRNRMDTSPTAELVCGGRISSI